MALTVALGGEGVGEDMSLRRPGSPWSCSLDLKACEGRDGAYLSTNV